MNYSAHIMRFFSAPVRALLLTPLLKFALKDVKDNPIRHGRAATQRPAKGIELVDMSDNMIDYLAEALSYAYSDDPIGYLFKGKELDMQLVQQFLLRKKEAVKWFRENPAKQLVTETRMQRDGSRLICRRATHYLESGLLTEAKLLFARATEIDETNQDAWLGLADALLELGLLEESARARARANPIVADD
jgi:tetratricopeptide (TPR) repeat protein